MQIARHKNITIYSQDETQKYILGEQSSER